MHMPRIFVAYAPRAGLRCAVAYLESGRDVYGWVLAPTDAGVPRGRYFVIEDYHAPGASRPLFIDEDDLYAGGLEESRSHELARLRDLMAHEWILWRGDPAARADLEAFAQAELAVGEVGIRFARLGRLSKLHATWTFYSPAFEDGVLECLSRHLGRAQAAAIA